MESHRPPTQSETEKDIAAEKASVEALLDSIGEPVIATDEYGKVNRANDIALEMLGYKRSEILNKPFMDVLKAYDLKGNPIAPLDRPIMRTLIDGAPVTDHMQYAKKDGLRFPVLVTVSPIMFDDKPIGTIEVFRDTTREQQIDRAKTEFVSVASHQLRTPLTAMRWYLELLLKGNMGPLNAEQQTSLREVYDSNIRMIELVSALLSVARIEVGTLTASPELSDIQQLAHDVVFELKPQIADKALVFNEYYDKALPSMPLDPDLTRVIFQNLLTNAVKYTPDGGNVSLRIEKEGRNVHIEVTDTGYGIPKRQQRMLFTKLFRADNVRQRDTDGTGLGLYIVQSIVKNSKGKIWFKSVENEGTTFFVDLPLKGMASMADPAILGDI
jgi:two-component system sensor histidine kinase VicK